MKSNPKYRKLSFLPRSLLKGINKLNQTLDPNAELKVIEEFRAFRKQTITSIRFLLIILITPLLGNRSQVLFRYSEK